MSTMCASARSSWIAFKARLRLIRCSQFTRKRTAAPMKTTANNPWLARYAAFVALATFLLIIAGALVTSNDAGLSVPDWPTSFGSFCMPLMVGGVKFEHGHRMIAGAVAILTVLLALWLWKCEPRRCVRRLGAVLLRSPAAAPCGPGASRWWGISRSPSSCPRSAGR